MGIDKHIKGGFDGIPKLFEMSEKRVVLMKKTRITILLFGIVCVGLLVLNMSAGTSQTSPETKIENDYKNVSYSINGQEYALSNGIVEVETVPNSASKTIVRYFGNEIWVDLNNDGRKDVVFLLTQETGGSGTFYYVVAALNTENGYIGSKAMFLGDRIAPQTTEVGDGNTIVVNYVDRAPGESFATQPSYGVSKYLQFNTSTMEFTEIENTNKSATSSILEEGVEGVWQNTHEPLAQITYSSDGVMRNIYNGNEINTGTWELTPPENDAQFSGTLHTEIDGKPFDYIVLEVSNTTLHLSYLERGFTLTYTRIPSSHKTTPETVINYNNDEYGFSLSYPTSWEVQEALKPREERALHEIVFSEKEYNMWRASVSVFIFTNDKNLTIQEWWANWLSDEETKEKECINEFGEGNAPCLFLPGLIESEKNSTIAGQTALTVELFRFDHTEVCTYTAHDSSVYGVCKDGSNNPNDPSSAKHFEQTDNMQNSFSFISE